MNEKQLKNIFSLPSHDRYEHFVKKVCDWEEVWLLEDTNKKSLILTPEKQLNYLPIWPHSDYAKAFTTIYPTYQPIRLELNIFIEKWLVNLNDNNVQLGILPNLDTTVWIINPLDLKLDLENELERYK